MKDFNLKKAKLEDGGLSIEWAAENGDQMKLTCKDNPHPQLKKSFQKLENFVVQMFQLNDDVEVRGFTLLKESKGCVIISVISDIADAVASLSTPVIRFEGEIYGFESEIEKDIEKATLEVYKYVKENKRAQLEVEFPEDVTVSMTVQDDN